MRVELGIPTRNNQKTIWATLDAFANQTRPPDRVHVVDASTDWTPYIVELFKSRVEKPFELNIERQTDSSGVGAARSRIYKQFNGDILACFDTNAVPEKNWLKKHVQTHREHPSVDVVSGVDSNRRSDFVESPHDRGFLVQKNCSIKKERLEAINGWDRQFTRGEDWDLAIRLWRNGGSSYVQGNLGRQYVGNEDLSNRFRARLDRPSSVRFLRKYGTWYAKFHPAHVLGDAVSVVSGILILITPLLALVLRPIVFSLYLIPLVGLLCYIIAQARARTATGSELRFILQCIPDFLILGYTALRELKNGPKSGWNYGGLD